MNTIILKFFEKNATILLKKEKIRIILLMIWRYLLILMRKFLAKYRSRKILMKKILRKKKIPMKKNKYYQKLPDYRRNYYLTHKK